MKKLSSKMKLNSFEFDILVIRIIFMVVSLIGCIWQLIDLSGLYFSYKTTINIQFEDDPKLDLPAITLCTNTSHVIQYEYLRQTFGDNLLNTSEADTNVWTEYLRNLTLGQQLLNATINGTQFFKKCTVMKPIALEDKYPKDYIGCENVSKYRESITYLRKCFTLSAQLNDENVDKYRIEHDLILQDNGFPLYFIKLNHRYINDLVLFMHSRHQPFQGFFGSQTNGIRLDFKRWQSVAMNYAKTTIELLPEPYQTKCMNYTLIGYKSQSHCIVKCKTEYFKQWYDGWHPDIPYTSEYSSNLSYISLKWRYNHTADKLIANNCLTVCGRKQNCINEYFTPNVIASWERDADTIETDEILIYVPAGLNKYYKHSPRLDLIEYICYGASVFGLWFGISITTISSVLIVFYNYYRNEKQKNNEIGVN